MAEFIPVEILTQIMSYLDFFDRKMTALVNKKWYSASHDSRLMKKVVQTFGSMAKEKDIETVLLNTSAVSVVFDGFDRPISLNSDFVKNFADMFHNVQSLTLKNCDLTAPVFMAILEHCPKLIRLDVSGCNSILMTGLLFCEKGDRDRLASILRNVRVLALASHKYLSDLLLNRFFEVCSSVEHLSVANNRIVFDSASYKSRNNGKPAEQKANSAVLSFGNIMTLLHSFSTWLRVLDFSRTSINDVAVGSLAAIEGLQLRELYLTACSEISDSAVVSICEHQSMLTVLDVGDCESVSDKGVTAIAACLPCLKKLVLVKCQVTELSICKLRCLQQLEHLDLNASYMVTSNGLRLGLCAESLRHLTNLNLGHCSSVHDGFVVEASEHLLQLSFLDLSSCKVTNIGLLAISRHLVNLQYLSLSWCKDITDSGILGIQDSTNTTNHRIKIKKHTDQCSLSLTVLRSPTKSGSDSLPNQVQQLQVEDFFPISHLKRLQQLNLNACDKLTNASIVQVMNFPAMKTLHLSWIPGITDESLVAISNGVPKLEELYLSSCRRITDAGMIELTERLRRLSLLSLTGCDRLTDQTIYALSSNASGLRQLDVSFCGHISVEAVEKLEGKFRHLQPVLMRHNPTKLWI